MKFCILEYARAVLDMCEMCFLLTAIAQMWSIRKKQKIKKWKWKTKAENTTIQRIKKKNQQIHKTVQLNAFNLQQKVVQV